MNKKDFFEDYKKQRENLVYYEYIRCLLSMCTLSAESVCDVGSGGMDVISHLTHIPRKISVDRYMPVCKENIEGIEADFMEWHPQEKFDVMCCFQVLEHIEQVTDFAQKLLELANKIVIISVPYLWKKEECASHIQDPVNLQKLAGWFGFEPTFFDIMEKRLIAVFLKSEEVRSSLLEANGKEFSAILQHTLSRQKGGVYEPPYEKIKDKKRIIIFGAGSVGRDYYKQLRSGNDVQIVLWVDNKYEEYQKEGYNVNSPTQMKEMEYDAVVIAAVQENTIKSMKDDLVKLGVNEEKIIER